MNTSQLLSGTIMLMRTAGPWLVARLVVAAWRDAAVDACRRVAHWIGRPCGCGAINEVAQ